MRQEKIFTEGINREKTNEASIILLFFDNNAAGSSCFSEAAKTASHGTLFVLQPWDYQHQRCVLNKRSKTWWSVLLELMRCVLLLPAHLTKRFTPSWRKAIIRRILHSYLAGFLACTNVLKETFSWNKIGAKWRTNWQRTRATFQSMLSYA